MEEEQDLFICPECQEEYSVFEDVFDCYKEHFNK